MTERELAPGEYYYSVLIDDGDELRRCDYSHEAWTGEPPDGSIGWWKSQVPMPEDGRMHWAPNDVMLHLLEQLESQPEKLDMRYVLALLLIRRRVMREEAIVDAPEGGQTIEMYCPRDDTMHSVAIVSPSNQRIDEIQDELAKLLFSKSI